MRSGWFWGTPMWEQYQVEYYRGMERPEEYKSSPLANDAVLPGPNYDYDWTDKIQKPFTIETHKTQVIDLTQPLATLWQGVRKSYHSIVHRANENYVVVHRSAEGIAGFKALHIRANGKQPRPDMTYTLQGDWIRDGYGLLIAALDNEAERWMAAAYWIVYQDKAYYCSGPSIERNVQHAVIWHSLELLKARGVTMVEMGQVDGATDKEKNIGRFKAGFGGTEQPYHVARRIE